jgi:DNA-binding MarR family transcriptional regulator
MKLEDEIQQRHFKTQKQKLAVNLLYTSNWLNEQYINFFKNTDLSVQQYNVLRILHGQYPQPCNLKLIKERMLDRSSDASRIVDRLVSKRLLTRTHCPSDRRKVNLLISSEGLAILQGLDFLDDSTIEMFKHLTEEQTKQLNDLLDQLRG